MTTRRTLKTVATTVFLLAAIVQADIINVPADYRAIQSALNNANKGDPKKKFEKAILLRVLQLRQGTVANQFSTRSAVA